MCFYMYMVLSCKEGSCSLLTVSVLWEQQLVVSNYCVCFVGTTTRRGCGCSSTTSCSCTTYGCCWTSPRAGTTTSSSPGSTPSSPEGQARCPAGSSCGIRPPRAGCAQSAPLLPLHVTQGRAPGLVP